MNRRALIAVVAILIATPMLFGFGGGSSPATDSIVRPKMNVKAIISDGQGIVTPVEYFTCDGKTFLPLQVGEGIMMIPFDKVKTFELGDHREKQQLEAVVTLGNGKQLSGTVDSGAVCTGATEFGSYRVEVKGIKSVKVD